MLHSNKCLRWKQIKGKRALDFRQCDRMTREGDSAVKWQSEEIADAAIWYSRQKASAESPQVAMFLGAWK